MVLGSNGMSKWEVWKHLLCFSSAFVRMFYQQVSSQKKVESWCFFFPALPLIGPSSAIMIQLETCKLLSQNQTPIPESMVNCEKKHDHHPSPHEKKYLACRIISLLFWTDFISDDPDDTKGHEAPWKKGAFHLWGIIILFVILVKHI